MIPRRAPRFSPVEYSRVSTDTYSMRLVICHQCPWTANPNGAAKGCVTENNRHHPAMYATINENWELIPCPRKVRIP